MGLFKAFTSIFTGGQKAPNYAPLADAQRHAADLQYKASQEGIKEWSRQNKLVRQDYTPYLEQGKLALKELRQGIKDGRFTAPKWDATEEKFEDFKFDEGDFKESPGYKFRQAEGEKAIRRQAAAGDGAGTGAHAKSLLAYNQDLASDEFNNSRNRAVQDYGIKKQNFLDRRSFRERDTQIQQNLLNNQYNQLSGQANIGLNALAGVTGNARNATHQQVQLGNLGANALGAGKIGAEQAGVNQQLANNAIKQQGFENFLGVGSLAVGAYNGAGKSNNYLRNNNLNNNNQYGGG